MISAAQHAPSQPLRLLAGRFRANCAALNVNHPELARTLLAHPVDGEYRISAGDDGVVLSKRIGEQTVVVPDPLPPEQSRRVTLSLFPEGRCTQSVLVAGLGYGWLWNALYTLPTGDGAYRPPLYFLASNLNELWAVLHVQEWDRLLADVRVKILVGTDAAEQLQRALLADPRRALPQYSIEIDPSLRPPSESFPQMAKELAAAREEQRQRLRQRLDCAYAALTAEALREKLRQGKPLRVLGFTSRASTFLQHSLRDWLDAFGRLGHQTRLLIEEADHETIDELECLRICDDFRPDVLLLMNHFRAEAPFLPPQPLAVMWLQDQMPKALSPEGGASQALRDFVVGYGRNECVTQYGYVATRFLPARIGVNEERFSPSTLSPSELRQFGCDVSFVSHASTDPQTLLKRCLADASDPRAFRLLGDLFERLRAIYDGGGAVTESMFFHHLVEDSIQTLKLDLPGSFKNQITTRLMQTVNDAFFRQQPLQWLADAGVNLHLYGRGWESHPKLARFARGVADNQTQLRLIYQASRINLQLTPLGAVHQRLCDGLAAGGFFLLRYCGSDLAGCSYQRIWEWCQAHQIQDDRALARQAPQDIRQQLDQLGWLIPDADVAPASAFLETLCRCANKDFSRLRAGMWSRECDHIHHVYRPLWEWCRQTGASTDDQIIQAAPPAIGRLLNQIGYFFQGPTCPRGHFIINWLRQTAEEGFDRFASCVWPDYDQVVFRTRDDLLARTGHYLANDSARLEIAARMRQAVLQKFTYRSVTQRLLAMMQSELERQRASQAA